MKLERVVTLASRQVRLQFAAMERSLRAAGCGLPLAVIPYDDGPAFPLPDKAYWWRDDEVLRRLGECRSHPMMRKYQCLTIGNYQYVDTDVVFLSDPAAALAAHAGFVTCCGHWRDVAHATTPDSEAVFRAASTTWQRHVFNAGQFACDRPLYTIDTLFEVAEEHRRTCLEWPFNDQPGMNLLVKLSGVPYDNLTLPPTCLESSWAGDYTGEYESYWTDRSRRPYLLHWAGIGLGDPAEPRPVDTLFLGHLTPDELAGWRSKPRRRRAKRRGASVLRFPGRRSPR